MEKSGALNFKVGQLAEMRSFLEGYRGAWFRCKIIDISLKENMIKLDCFDFLEEIIWTKMYEMPPYGRKVKHVKKQLMVRPHYPPMFKRSEMPPVNSISEACVVFDGVWKVGDLVDWFKDDCYWSARVIKVLGGNKVQIQLPRRPAGEGKGEIYEAFLKDLRPCLDWSASKGWTLPTLKVQIPCSAQLIFPLKQGMDSEGDTYHVGTSICQESVQTEEPKMDDEEIFGPDHDYHVGLVVLRIIEDSE